MVMLVYRRISGKMIPMMKDFFRWFKDVDALNVWWKNRDITLWTCLKMWAGAHLGVIFCRDGEKSRFLHVSTYGYRSESMWSYLIYLIYLDLDRDLPLVDAAGVYLISWKNIFYRSVAGSTIRKWFNSELTCHEFRIIISKYGHEYFTDPKKQHLHCHAKYPCLCMWPAH